MNRKHSLALDAAFLVLSSILLVSCAERDTEEGPIAATAAPLVEVLRFEDVRNVDVAVFPGSGTLVSAAFCRHSPPLAWADRLAQAGPCRLLHWRPVERLSAVNLDTGTVRWREAREAFRSPAGRRGDGLGNRRRAVIAAAGRCRRCDSES